MASTSELKPLILYTSRLFPSAPPNILPLTNPSTAGGPNPFKVVIILEELQLPFTYDVTLFQDMKSPDFPIIHKNPNGRAPALEDPNNQGFVVAESGAIIQYLIDTYDKENRLTNGSTGLNHHRENQWLHIQMSGQGPYFGQAMWFGRYHPVDVPSAKKRYLDEIIRVLGVLDKHLEKREWLVGEKITYVDLAFVPWDYWFINHILPAHGKEGEWEKIKADAPNWWRWHQKMMERPSVKTAEAFVTKLREEQKPGPGVPGQ